MISGTTQDLYDIWGSSASNIFAVGALGTILHYDGTTWFRMVSGADWFLYRIWGSSATDVFVVGSMGTILHYGEAPTLITLSSFTATPSDKSVLLKWTTASEIDNAGFNLYRAESVDGEYVNINDALIPAKGSPTEGAIYRNSGDTILNS